MDLTALDDACKALNDAVTCSLELVLVAGKAVHACGADMSKLGQAIDTELEKTEALSKWKPGRVANDWAKQLSRLADSINVLTNAKGKLDRAQALIGFLSAAIDVVAREKVRDRMHLALDRASRGIDCWGDLAVALYQTLRGLARGDNPLPLVVASLEASPCDGKGDRACAFRLAGNVVEAV